MRFFYRCIVMCIVWMICLSSLSFATMSNYELDGITRRLPVANLYIEGNLYTGNSGVRPLIIDSRMYIAATDLSYIANATVGWDGATESVLINSTSGNISYFKGGTSYTINGETRSLGGNTKFYVVNKKSMIPVSILPVFSNATVNYDINTNTTTIIKGAHGDLFENEENSNDTETVIPVNPIPPAVNPAPPVSTIESVEKCVTSFTNLDTTKEMINISAGKYVEYESMYLQSPSRVVIDILNYNAKAFDGDSVLKSKFVKSANHYFHADTSKYRITLNLKDGISTSDVSIESTTEGLNVIYKAPAKSYKYVSDRVSSELSLVLDSAVAISEPTINGTNSLILMIPSNNIVMEQGTKEYSDRNLKSINTVLDGTNYKATITLNDRVSHVMTSNGSTGTVSIKFKKANNSTPTIVIDAGHGGKDPGAVNSGIGINEKNLNLTASTNLATKLRNSGYNVIETRNTDYFVELKERANIANTRDSDLFISVHHNSGSSSASGIETLYYPSEDNKAIASIVQRNLINATGAIDRKIQSRPNLVVLNSTKMPAVLLELGFMSNGNEASKLLNQEYVNNITDSVVKSVNEYFGR